MAIRGVTITVGTSPTLLAVGNAGGSRVYAHQDGNSNHGIFLGPSTVGTASGFLIHKGEHIDIYLPEGESLYAVSSSAETIYVLQTGGK
jgi:hypothetical protein